jgi:hypothetical protein
MALPHRSLFGDDSNERRNGCKRLSGYDREQVCIAAQERGVTDGNTN